MTILTISHRILCMPPPGNHTCPPATMHATPHPRQPHTPSWQPRTPPGNHACPLATMHAPWQPCMPPSPGNHACPPGSHAPPWQPHMPPAATHPWAATHAPPPVDRITDTCKNITFPQLRLRAVNMSKTFYRHVTRVLRKVVQNDDYTVRYWSAHGSRFRQI